MSKKTLVSALVMGGLVAAALAAPAAAEGHRCLQVGHIRYTHMVDPRTMIAQSDRGEKYTVRFTAACRVGGVHTHNHFVYTDLQVGTCFGPRDVMPTSESSPCFIESVTPLDSDS